MSPEERQLLQGLFDRMKASATAPRDGEAEQMIADNLRSQPYAPYLLAQTVIIQDQALQAANQRLQQLEQEVRDAQQSRQGSSGGFLSGLFGGGAASAPPVPQRSVWNQGGGGGLPGGAPPAGNYPPQQEPYPPQGYGGPGGGYGAGFGGGMGGGPWGGGQPAGGGFLRGALSTAAGVAGGVLMADSIRSLFGGSHGTGLGGLGIAQGVPGMGGETVVNNYYGGDDAALRDADRAQDALQDANDAYNQNGPTAADWQQDADQDQDDAQDAGDYNDDI